MRSQWFVIHTLSGQEQKVKESIEKRIKTDEMQDYVKEVLVPMEKVVEVRNQKKTVSTRKLWPGYVFVDMVLLDENNRIIEKPWYFIKETQGVIGFVGGEPPVPTPAEKSSPSRRRFPRRKRRKNRRSILKSAKRSRSTTVRSSISAA
jgi:transcriptional antiterminator NusG